MVERLSGKFEKKGKRVNNLGYMKIDENTKALFLEKFENEISRGTQIHLEVFEMKAKEIAKEVMEKKFWKRVIDKDKIEQMWFTNTIKKEISIRRNYNKKKRHAVNDNEKELYENLYQQQKMKIQKMVIEAMINYEEKLTNEIKNAKNRNKSLHMYIKKLRGEKIKDNSKIIIYDTEGAIIDENSSNSIESELKQFWKGIYQKHRNTIAQIWNSELKRLYEIEMRNDRQMDNNLGINIGLEIREMPIVIRDHIR